MKKILQAAAKKGRGEDTLLAHLTPGETVVPEELMQSNGSLRQAIADAFLQAGIEPGRYVAGGQDDVHNPATGLSQFDYAGGDETGDDDRETNQKSEAEARETGLYGDRANPNSVNFDPTFDPANEFGQPASSNNLLNDIFGIPTSWAGLRDKFNPDTQRGFFNAVTALAPAPIGILGNLALTLNERYKEAYGEYAPNQDYSNRQEGGADSVNDVRGGGGTGNPNQYFTNGTSSPFSWPGVNDWRYTPGTSPGSMSPGRQQFLQALSRVNDPSWLRSNVGFASGDDLLDSIFMPYEQGAFDYLGRAQKRGMLDVPSYQAASDVLKQQGQQGRTALRTKLNEQGDSFLQPLRATAAQIQGDVLGGKFDSTAFSDQFVNDLFGGAINDTKSRVNEFGNSANDPFAPATALYQGLEQGGNIQGSPLYSAIADASKSRYSPLGRSTARGVGSKGVF